jgi:copper chaperone
MFFSKKASLAVQGMSCSHCEQSVVQGVQDISGVDRVKANHQKDRVEVFYKNEVPDLQAVREKILALGYEIID